MLILFCIAVVLLVVAGGGWLWLLAERKSLRAECGRATRGWEARALEQSERDQVHALTGQLALAKQQVAVGEEARRQMQTQFDRAQAQLKESFQVLAGDALARASAQFLQLAHQSFAGEQKDAAAQLDQRKAAIEQIVKPVRESLDRYSLAIQQIEASRQSAYGQLTQQVTSLMEDQRRLRTETGNLVTALRRPEVRGRWGEMQLKRVAEMAGMIEHCDFVEQFSIPGAGAGPGEGRGLRPDMVVNLPNERVIVVDAKTPLDAFLSSVEAPDGPEREAMLDQHAQQIDRQVRLLAGKEYWKQFDRPADFVVLFIPGESFLYPAVQRRPEMIEQAMALGVVIATPTTLVSLLKVVAMGWREEQLAENAQKISEAGKELHERLCVAIGHLGKLGGSLEGAVKAYNQFVGSIESRVLPQARKFEELGAVSGKPLPGELGQVQVVVREVGGVLPGAGGDVAIRQEGFGR